MEQKKKTRLRKLLEQGIGWLCLVIGILGLFTPFLQGIILVLIGLIILSATYPKLKQWIMEQFKKGESRSPKIRIFLIKIEKIYNQLVTIFEIKEETKD